MAVSDAFDGNPRMDPRTRRVVLRAARSSSWDPLLLPGQDATSSAKNSPSWICLPMYFSSCGISYCYLNIFSMCSQYTSQWVLNWFLSVFWMYILMYSLCKVSKSPLCHPFCADSIHIFFNLRPLVRTYHTFFCVFNIRLCVHCRYPKLLIVLLWRSFSMQPSLITWCACMQTASHA